MSKNSNDIILHAVQVEDRLYISHDGITQGTPRGPVALDRTMPKIPEWTDPGITWAYWGDNDLLPTEMMAKVGLVPIAGATLNKKIQMMVGEDIRWYRTDELRRLGNQAEQVYLPEVEDFMEANRIETEWFPAQCADFCLPYNCFSELTLSNNRKKITGLYHIAAEHARLSKANKRNQIDYLLYSYHFPFGTAQADQNRVALPLYKWYDRDAFLEGLRGFKFAWHTRFPTPGLIYYARAWWYGLFRKGGWMDVSAQVPKIVSAMQNNQISLKYMIAIPEAYFVFRYPNWQTFSGEKRQEVIDAKIGELNTYLAGAENVYKSVSYVFKENEITGAHIGKIEITSIDDKAKAGTWVPDSYAADAQIVQGLGMDPSQIGLAPEGGKMGAGSGSDKMQSFNQLTLLNTSEQRLVLEPLNFISRYNNWGLTAMVGHTHLTTQDDNRTGISNNNPPSQ